MTYTDRLLQRLRSLSRCEHSDLSIGDEAADEIERLRAQVTKLRALAADAYQAAGAHDWPVEWLDALSAAASALPFSIDGLLPMATPELVARASRAESELAALREEIARYATSLTVALGHRDEFKRRAEAAESELAAIKLRLIEDCDAARDFPANTCGASRHAQMIAESLISCVPYAMLTDDPAYCGQSILSTVKSLFTARTELAALRGRIDGGKATSTIVDRARELAYRAHAGQVDKAGRPYIEHVARVAAAVSDDPAAEAVGWVHDVMEDQPQYATLMMERLPASLYCAANLLDRNVAGGPLGYYERIRENPIALRVKLADIADNADESRLALLDEKTASRLRAKYADARRRLGVDEG